jgi:divalent metal cation (Fe/Co/Zn/Cd) transporter
VKSLLVGEAADPALRAKIDEIAATVPAIERVLALIAVQQGPGEIMVAMKLALRPELDTKGVVDAINAFEQKLKASVPEVRWSFIEPDDAA